MVLPDPDRPRLAPADPGGLAQASMDLESPGQTQTDLVFSWDPNGSARIQS